LTIARPGPAAVPSRDGLILLEGVEDLAGSRLDADPRVGHLIATRPAPASFERDRYGPRRA
jgi:hypothetical protein